MCGILGFTQCYRGLPTGVLTRGLSALSHRGPDQKGRFTSAHVSLGATRLRVIDLEGGDQPLHSVDGDITIVFNGEIYNHCEIRDELEAIGATFKTRCDTEVILNAFVVWGTACFARLRGMFAVAIWAQSEQRLILARDRMGIKPLYYRYHDRDISFGSELKCIFANPEVPRRINLHGLNCYLNLNYVPGPFTLIDGILKVMPGHFLDWQKGQLTTHSFLPPRSGEPFPKSIDEASTELDMLLTQSVSEQLASDVPVGLWLSGGLDSSTIAHYATHLSSTPLKTFSITFRGKSFDESRYIKEVSKLYGTDHTEFDLNGDGDLADVIEELSYYSDEPSADAGAVPVWFLAKMSRKDVTVVLSGEGSDELFGGYLTYKADNYNRLFSRVPRLLRHAAFACAQRIPVSDEKIGFDYKVKRFLQGSLLSPEAAHVFWNGAFSEEEKRSIFLYADDAPMAELLGQMRPGHGLERYLEFDRRYSLPDGILYKVDRMSMAHSLEVRPPFLDDRIVDFAARLPRRFKMTLFQSKRILRHLMKEALPPAVLRRPKVGFDIPIHEWFRGILRPLLLDTLTQNSIEESGVLHWPAVNRLIHEHIERKANWGYQLWGLLTLVLWMKRWNVEAPAQRSETVVAENLDLEEESSLLWQPASFSAPTSQARLT
jgi:asparagine synthase (glutamine-hydrolysing)